MVKDLVVGQSLCPSTLTDMRQKQTKQHKQTHHCGPHRGGVKKMFVQNPTRRANDPVAIRRVATVLLKGHYLRVAANNSCNLVTIGTRALLRTTEHIKYLPHLGAAIMVSSKVIFENRQHPLQHLGRFLVFAEQPVRQCQIVEGGRNLNATVPIVLHIDVDGAFEDVLGLVVVLELSVGCGQAGERLRHLEVFLATVLLFHLHNPLEDVLRLLLVLELTVRNAQVHEHPRYREMVVPIVLLFYLQGPLEDVFRLLVLPEPLVR